MSSYVYMKVLESSPERYDRGIRWLSGGRIDEVYDALAVRVGAASGRRVLDVGCGTGGAALACAARGAHVVGIDLDAGMIEVAREKAKRAKLADPVEWIVLGAMEIEDRFEPESLDGLVSCLAFSELLPEERAHVLKTARSRLRPGAKIAIADEVVPRTRARRIWRALRRAPVAAVTYVLTQATTRPVSDLAGSLRAAGFSDVVEERFENDDFAIVEGVCPEAARPEAARPEAARPEDG